MDQTRTYIIRSRWFGDTWQTKDTVLENVSYEYAASMASKCAKDLDKLYGSAFHWNVMLYREGSDSAYFELFHGRTD